MSTTFSPPNTVCIYLLVQIARFLLQHIWYRTATYFIFFSISIAFSLFNVVSLVSCSIYIHLFVWCLVDGDVEADRDHPGLLDQQDQEQVLRRVLFIYVSCV